MPSIITPRQTLLLATLLLCSHQAGAAQSFAQAEASVRALKSADPSPQATPPQLKDTQDAAKFLEFVAYHGIVTDVSDGQTLAVATESKKLKIRLLGISSLAKGLSLSREARDSLAQLVLHKSVDAFVPQDAIDKLNAVVPGKIVLAGQDIGLAQIERGYAWLNSKDERYLSQKEHKLYGEAQHNAADNKLGMWHCPEVAKSGSSVQSTKAETPQTDPEKVSGTVVVEIIVDESGKVVAAKALCGHPLLQQASVEAAYKARFTPTLLAGRPVKVQGYITYNFVLQ